MRKFGIALYTIFALLFAGLPVFVLMMSAKGAASYEGFSLWPFWGIAAAAVFVCLIPKELPKVPDWLAAAVWGCLAFQMRWRAFHAIEKYMVMKYDFAAVLESARGVKQAKEAIFTHWAFYPRILQIWDTHFGNDFSYRNAVYFNLMIGGLLVVLVYLIARRIWKRQRAAMLAAAILTFWPSFSYYASVISNEHLAMFFMLCASYAAILAWQFAGARRKAAPNEGANWVQKLSAPAYWAILAVLTAGAGVCAGLADLFKQFSPVFVVASFAAGFVFLLIEYRRETPGGLGRLGKRLLCLLLAIVLMFGCASVVKEGAYRWLEGYLGMPVARNAMAHFLWIGLNSRGEGMWTQEEGMKVYELAEQYGNDYDRVMDGLWALLREDYEAHPEALAGTIRHKMEKDWEADIGITLWIKALYDEEAAWLDAHPGELLTWEITRAELDTVDFDPGDGIAKSSAAYYMCVMGLIALGGLLAIFLRSPLEMYLRLVFYGYALLLILSEAQGRYQIVLFPFFALLAAGAAETLGLTPQMLKDWANRQTPSS
ncbi:MAG: phospholipid carrier-dependent glycosyltransferase [Clostridia bacterium]|nr:phospholipid carrier-dependent glycosyltransferase [Clostridia bacterium]